MVFRLERALTKDDLAGVARMDNDIFGSEEDLDPRIEDTIWWIAYSGNEEAGYCGVRFVECDASMYLYLSRAGVLEEFRGQGLQRKMIKARVKFGRDTGCDWIVTDTAPWNWPSANNLFRAGFLLYEPEEKWAAEHALYFRRQP